MLVTARTKKLVEINLKPTTLEEGYLPRIPAKKGIYMGENLVKNDGNCCKIIIINTSDDDDLIGTSPQDIHPFNFFEPEEGKGVDSEEDLQPIEDVREKI